MPKTLQSQTNLQNIPKITTLSQNKKRFLVELVRLKNLYLFTNPCRYTLANKMGVTLKSIDRWNKEFEEKGFLKVIRSSKASSYSERNHYILDSMFDDLVFREQLAQIQEFSSVCQQLPMPYRGSAQRIIDEKKKTFPCEYVAPIFKGYILNINSDSISVSNVPKSVGDSSTDKTFSKKGERKRAMTDQKAKLLQKLNERFPLSTHGIIKLSAFSEFAIQNAITHSQMALTKLDPFAYLASICLKYDEKNNYKPEWHEYHLRREALKIPSIDDTFMDVERFEALLADLKEEKQQKYLKRDVTKSSRPQQAPFKYEPGSIKRAVDNKDIVEKLSVLPRGNIFAQILIDKFSNKSER